MARARAELKDARHKRLRKHIAGTPERPRLAVFRSLRHIYAQVIDDTTGTTLAAASTAEKDLAGAANAESAKKVGEAIGARARAKGIEKVVFDRGGFRYHGRIASLAEAARAAGLEF